MLDEIERTSGLVSDLVASEALQFGRRSVEDLRRKDRVGPPVAHAYDIRRYDRLCRQPTLDLPLYVAGRRHQQAERPVITGRGLRGQAEQTHVENCSNGAAGEFRTGGIQDPGLNALVVVDELQRNVRHCLIDPGIQKQVRAGQVGIFGTHPHAEVVDHPPGDLGRRQDLNLRLDGVYEKADAGQAPGLRGYLPSDLEWIVDLNGATGLVDRALLRYRPDGRGRRYSKNQDDKPDAA